MDAWLREIEAARIVPDRLRAQAARRTDAEFLLIGETSIGYGEMDRLSDRLAGGLAALGVAPGDRLLVLLPNCPEIATCIFAAPKAGAILVTLNCYLRGDFLAYQVNDAGGAVIVTDRDGVAELRRIAPSLPGLRHVILTGAPPACGEAWENGVLHSYCALLDSGAPPPDVRLTPSSIMSILYTSGTTGKAKGCVLSHGYYLSMTRPFFRAALVTPDDRMLTAMPLFHAGAGLTFLMNTLQAGISLVVEPAFSASRFMPRVAETGATIGLTIAAMGAAILATPESEADRRHLLRYMQIIPMSPADQDRFEARFGVKVFSMSYGQTEVGPVSMLPHIRTLGTRRETTGKPPAQFEVAVVDDDDAPLPVNRMGEIVVRPRMPDAMFQGYWNNPAATVAATRNLWFHTGDFGSFDADGYLTFHGRKSDALRRRGENVSAWELEQAIVQHEAIHAVAVHAVPSDLGEDDIKACLVLAEGRTVEPTELFAFFARTLPYFALPRYVELFDQLPLTAATGRVMKQALRARGIGDAWDFERLGLRLEKAQRRG